MLLKYCHGVLVPAKYQNITASWQAFQFIEVTDGLNKWKIEVKKRNNMTELHRGWEVLWKDMKLKAGDTCVFESLGSNFKFNLRVFYRIR
ncbi:hypothetical protein DCAR_0728270 [Daucus carota subsp. sativus]|uniref:TF-B3 domain-containing protein n=1 Tax=Daucus carota subsp. sativus TaxID=79200 RepID=A0AAF0XLT9_DAUCS|nr:hypothetical protein DCAR_0728270 [Daucus carota subsp. sativus]